MTEFPALPLWTDAYLADTTHLTTIEHGAYLLLLMAMWRSKECRLPNNDKLLAKYAGLTAGQWSRVKPSIWSFFQAESDGITQGRLTDEAELVRRNSRKQSDNSRSRWLKNKGTGDAMGLPDECQTDAPTTTTTTTTTVGSGGGSREPAGAIPSDGLDAAEATKRFLALRSELWPSECGFPAPTLTLQSQAAELLTQAPLTLVLEVMERGMRSAAAQGKPASHSFKAFHRSMASASINHQQAATVAAGGNSNESRNHNQQRRHGPDLEQARRATFEAYAEHVGRGNGAAAGRSGRPDPGGFGED